MSLTAEDTLKLVVHVLHTLQVPAKPTEIAARALQPDFRGHCVQHGFDLQGFDGEFDLGRHIGQCIAGHLKRTATSRQVVERKPGNRWGLGPWAMQTLRLSNLDLLRPADAQYTGLVGEFATMSELLACNWNVVKLPHDDGVDLIATKAGELRTIQVKTAHASAAGNRFLFNVQRWAHDSYASVRHYYVLVLRRIHGTRYLNDFLILNSQDVKHLEVVGALSIGEQQSWRIVVDWNEGVPHIGEEDLSNKLNRFGTLFI